MTAIYPEVVEAARSPLDLGGWRVESGSAQRGDAYCDFGRRTLRVPSGPSHRERAVRAHELMHVRISPHQVLPEAVLSSTSARARECAEEYRVNRTLRVVGLDTSALCDGTERHGGAGLAEVGDWSEAVCFYLAVKGTGAEAPYLRGISRVASPWAKTLRHLGRRVDEIDASLDVAQMTDVNLDDEGCPRGYRAHTLSVAELVTRMIHAAPPRDADDVKRLSRSLLPGARRAPSGVFAPLVWRSDSLGEGSTALRGSRSGRVTHQGSALRYPTRLLTDPYARAFVSGRRRGGGVIVLDQSGSMDLTREDVERVARRAPGSWVLGYSHRPGDAGATPNAWVLAGPGGMVREVPTGNVGNGVDGPILRFAVTLNRGRGPLYWVSDGQVTDSNDHPSTALSRECALTLLRHRFIVLRSVDDISPSAVSTPWSRLGRVGEAVRSLEHAV